MSMTLPVDRVVKVSVTLAPLAAPRRNFGTLLLLGDSLAIDQAERLRVYAGIDAVAADFGAEAPEYKAAELYFGQSPRPSTLAIGRWVREPAPAILRGAALTQAEAALSAWTGITDGTLTVTVGGVEETVEGLDFSGAVTLEGVAAIVGLALNGAGVWCEYDGHRFILSTLATGAAATLGHAGGPLAEQMKVTAQTAPAPIPGMDAEAPIEAAMALADRSGDWYALAWAAADGALEVEDHVAVSGFIEAATKPRLYAVTTTDSRTLEAGFADDVASRLSSLARRRSLVVYSANPFAAVSALGRAFTVNFAANRSAITLKFKQLPGIVAEGLTETQATALEAKRCNVFAAYDNATAIFQDGVMAGPAYFDEIHGLDWLANAIQTECWNLLYQSKTKIPQTDSGTHQIVTTIEATLGEAVANGLVAPGTWNADGFGQLERGDTLPKGFYVFAGRIDDQPQSEREQRKAPPIQVAVKLAGAVHSTDVAIDVNR